MRLFSMLLRETIVFGRPRPLTLCWKALHSVLLKEELPQGLRDQICVYSCCTLVDNSYDMLWLLKHTQLAGVSTHCFRGESLDPPEIACYIVIKCYSILATGQVIYGLIRRRQYSK